ncbi:hypothetical protein PT974_04966 [Cladobotryum mycophilum]|uniref:Uncharacterized protein n=1 Tax=Cladobotryum mycophilum TaxID=491253 RepID=A0ABR0SR11_9HYPO
MEGRLKASREAPSATRRRGNASRPLTRMPDTVPAFASASTPIGCPIPPTSPNMGSATASSLRPLLPPSPSRPTILHSKQSSPSLVESVLGVHLGTTASRATCVSLDAKDGIDPRVRVVEPEEEISGASNKFDIPSQAMPFRLDLPPKQCLTYTTDTQDITLSSKMILYVRGAWEQYQKDTPDSREYVTAIRRIPQVNTFWRHFETNSRETQGKIIDHLEKIFLEHLSTIKEASDHVARVMGLRIIRLSIAIPSNWDRRLENDLLKYLRKIWVDILPEHIYFIYETEGIGHWLLGYDTFQRREERYERYIVVDLGAHTMSISSFQVVRDKDSKRVSFYAVRDTECEHGGSEIHAIRVRDQVAEQVKQQFPQLSPEGSNALIKGFMSDYCDNVRSKINGQEFRVSTIMEEPMLNSTPPPDSQRGIRKRRRHDDDDDGDSRVRKIRKDLLISNEDASDYFEEAYQNALKRLEATLKESASEAKQSLVVLTGGGFMNANIEDMAKKAIEASGLTYKDWVKESRQTTYRSSIVSKGVALAAAQTITVQEYMKRAVFAIDREGIDEKLPIIFREGRSQPITLDCTGDLPKGFKIVCAPLAPNDDPDTITRFGAHQFWNLGPRKSGKYRIRMRYEHVWGDKHYDWLVLEQEKLGREGFEKGPEIRWLIYYNPGAHVCLVDHEQIGENRTAQKEANIFLDEEFREAIEEWQDSQSNPDTNLWEHRIAKGLFAATDNNERSDESNQPRPSNTERTAIVNSSNIMRISAIVDVSERDQTTDRINTTASPGPSFCQPPIQDPDLEPSNDMPTSTESQELQNMNTHPSSVFTQPLVPDDMQKDTPENINSGKPGIFRYFNGTNNKSLKQPLDLGTAHMQPPARGSDAVIAPHVLSSSQPLFTVHL